MNSTSTLVVILAAVDLTLGLLLLTGAVKSQPTLTKRNPFTFTSDGLFICSLFPGVSMAANVLIRLCNSLGGWSHLSAS